MKHYILKDACRKRVKRGDSNHWIKCQYKWTLLVISAKWRRSILDVRISRKTHQSHTLHFTTTSFLKVINDAWASVAYWSSTLCSFNKECICLVALISHAQATCKEGGARIDKACVSLQNMVWTGQCDRILLFFKLKKQHKNIPGASLVFWE